MATFEPQLPDVAGGIGGQDMNWSRGQMADTSKGDAMRGMADLLGQGIKAADTAFKIEAREQVTAAIDKVRNESGVDDALKLNAAQSGQDVPPDLAQAVERIQMLREGKKAGTMPDTQYYAKMESAVREIRARFGGYRDYIDNVVKDVAGVDPANALRRSLMENIRAGQNTDQARLEKEMTEARNLGEPGRIVAERIANGNPMTWPEIYALNSNYTARVKKNEYIRSTIETDKMIGDANKRDAFDKANKEVTVNLAAALNGTLQSQKIEYTDLVARLRSQPPGMPIAPEDEAKLRSLGAAINSGLKADVERTLSQGTKDNPSWNEKLNDPESIARIRKQAHDFIDAISQDVTDNKMGLTAVNVGLIDAINNSDKLNMYSQNEVLRRVKVLREAGGDSFVSAYMFRAGQTGQLISSIDATMNGMTLGNLLSGDPNASLKQEFQARKTQGTTPQQDKVLIDTVVDAASGDKILDPKAHGRLMIGLFGQNNSDFISQVNPDQRHAVFSRMTSPEMAAKARELGEKVDPSIWANYRSWVLKNSKELYQQDWNAAQVIQANRENQNLVWNPHTFQLSLAQGPANGGVITNATESILGGPSGQIKDNINRANAAVVTMLKAQGASPELINATILDNMAKSGFNINSAKEGSFVGSIGRAIDNAYEKYGNAPANSLDPRVPQPLQRLVAFHDTLMAPGRAFWLEPKFTDNLSKALNDMDPTLRRQLSILSAGRSYDEQAHLKMLADAGLNGGRPAAAPGSSLHEKGLAIDLTPANGVKDQTYYRAVAAFKQAAEKYGISNLPNDFNHFQMGTEQSKSPLKTAADLRPKTIEEARKLPPGTTFTDPNGVVRTTPGPMP